MGKIKSRLVRKVAKTLMVKGIDFTENFEENKKILGDEMPSKKMRNQLAGHLVRVKKQEKKENVSI